MTLNQQALEFLREHGITPQQWATFHIGDAGDRWPGSPCGCDDVDCAGYHHEPGKECWCIDVMLSEYLDFEGDRWRTMLTPLAYETLDRASIRPQQWARFHFDVTQAWWWWGGSCGCPDHHCNPYHHNDNGDCACLPGLIELYLKYNGDSARRSDAYETWNAELIRRYAIWDQQSRKTATRTEGTDD